MSADLLTDGRNADQLHEQGRTWVQVADDLRMSSPTVAQRLAKRYRDHADELAAREQLPLFERPTP